MKPGEIRVGLITHVPIEILIIMTQQITYWHKMTRPSQKRHLAGDDTKSVRQDEGHLRDGLPVVIPVADTQEHDDLRVVPTL